MTENIIERYDTFNTKVCPDKLIFEIFNCQTIPSNCYNFLNYDNEDGNNIPGTPVEDSLPNNKLLEDAVMPNDEDINDEIIIDDDSSLA